MASVDSDLLPFAFVSSLRVREYQDDTSLPRKEEAAYKTSRILEEAAEAFQSQQLSISPHMISAQANSSGPAISAHMSFLQASFSNRVRRQAAVDTLLAQGSTSPSSAPAAEQRPALPAINVAKALSVLRESCNDTTPKRWETYDDFVLSLVRHYRLIADPVSVSDLTPGLRKKAVASFVTQLLKEKNINWQQELGPDPNDVAAIYYDGLMFRNASGTSICAVVTNLEARIQQVLSKRGLGDIPGLAREILPLLTVDSTVSFFPHSNIIYGSTPWITLWTGISILTEHGLDPTPYTEAQLMDVGRAVLIEQGQQGKVNTGSLLFMAHVAGVLDIRTLNPNNKQAIHDQLMAFVKTAFADDFQIIEALAVLAHTPYPTRRQLAEDNLRAAGIPATKPIVDAYMKKEVLDFDAVGGIILDGIIKIKEIVNEVCLSVARVQPASSKAVTQAREKLCTQSLKAEFNNKFDDYENVASTNISKIIAASVASVSKRLGINLHDASITVHRTQREINEQGAGVSHGATVSTVGSTLPTYTLLNKVDSEGYFICIQTPTRQHQYFFSLAQGREFELPAGTSIRDWSREHAALVFGVEPKFESHVAQKLVRSYGEDELASGSAQDIAYRVKAAVPATLKLLRRQAYEQLFLEEVVEEVENALIPFRSTYMAIRNGEDIKTILLDAGLDALIFLPAIGEGLSLGLRISELAADVMLKELETLPEKGLLQAMTQGSASLMVQSPALLEQGANVLYRAAENALWLPHDILSLLRGGRRWAAKGMRSLLQSLEKTNPNLAQKLSQAFAKAGSRVAEDGQAWRLSEDFLKVTSKTNSQTTSVPFEAGAKTPLTPYVKASTANGETRFLQRVDGNRYIEVNPQTLAPEGSFLLADRAGALRHMSLIDAVEKFKVNDPAVIKLLKAQTEPEDHLFKLASNNKCYAKIADQFVEIVPNRIAPIFWRLNDPMLLGRASADYVMPSMIWNQERQQWQQVDVPRLLGGGGDTPTHVGAANIPGTSSGTELTDLPDNVIHSIADFYEEDKRFILSLSFLNNRFYALLKPYRDYVDVLEEIKGAKAGFFSLEDFNNSVKKVCENSRGIRRKKLLLALSSKLHEKEYINPWLTAARETVGGELVALDKRVRQYESLQAHLLDLNEQVAGVLTDYQLIELVALGNDADEVIDAVLKIRTALPNDSEDDIETLLESILDRDEPSYNSSRALFTLSTRIAKIKELIPSATANDLRKFASFPEYIEFFCEHADEIQQVVPGAFDRNFLPPFTGEESQETVEGVLRGAIRGWRALLDHYPEINRVMKLSIPVGDFVDLVFVGRGDEIIISLGTNASKIEEALPDFSATMVMRLAMSWSPENRNRLDSFAPYVMKVKELTPGAQDTKRMMLAFLGDNPRAIETCLKYFPKIKTALPNVGYEQLIELAFSRGYIPILVLGENASKIKEILPSINDQYVLELGRRETNSKLMKLSEKIPRLKDFNVNNPSYEEFSEDKYKAFSEFLFREEGEPLAKKSRNE